MDEQLFEMETYVSIINIFQLYYRKLYNKSEPETLFDGINYENEASTNRSMELLYEYIYEYKNNSKKGDEYIKLYKLNKNLDNFNNIYCLLINDKIEYYSPTFITLLIYLNNLDWTSIEWKIANIK